jgi:hypothetical protein
MPTKFAVEEEAIAKASKAIDEDLYLKGTEARGRPASSKRGGHNKKLLIPQNNALKEYIFMLHSAGTPANLEAICIAAGRLLGPLLLDRRPCIESH